MAYFTVCPTFYSMVHKRNIEDFIILETSGEMPCNISIKKLKELVYKYILINSDGIDENNIDDYINNIICQITI